MNASIIIIAMLVVFIIIFAIKGFKIIQQSQTMVIERLGQYHRTLSAGINIIWPIFDKPRSIDWKFIKTDVNGKVIVRKETITRIDLRETVYDFPKQNVITRDNVAIEINALLYFQIIQMLSDPFTRLLTCQTLLRN